MEFTSYGCGYRRSALSLRQTVRVGEGSQFAIVDDPGIENHAHPTSGDRDSIVVIRHLDASLHKERCIGALAGMLDLGVKEVHLSTAGGSALYLNMALHSATGESDVVAQPLI